MARRRVNIVTQFEKRLESYHGSLKKDKTLKRLSSSRGELRRKLENNLLSSNTRTINLASEAGLVFRDLSKLEKEFPGYIFTTIPANPNPGQARHERKPYEILRDEDDEFHMEFYHCDMCNGWIPGDPLEHSGLHDSMMPQRETTYSCSICRQPIAREYSNPF